MMKAQILYGPDDLKYEETGLPKPAEDEVLVRVMNAGICGSDIPRIFTTGAHRHPLIPGHEFAGQVVDANGHEEWAGRRVGIFPLIPCRKCDCCQAGHYEMCRDYNYLGSRCDGGFAEYAAVPVWNLLALPDAVSFEQAAMLEPTSVAMHAIRRLGPKPDEITVVYALGTIGLLTVMLLKAMGLEQVYAIGKKPYQRELAKELGATALTREEFAALGIGADCLFECAGRNETICDAIELTAPGARVCLVGNPASDISFPKDTYWKILRRQLTVTGTWNSSYQGDGPVDGGTGDGQADDWHAVLDLLAAGKLHPERLITHRVSLEHLMDGLVIMRDKTGAYVKIMAEMP